MLKGRRNRLLWTDWCSKRHNRVVRVQSGEPDNELGGSYAKAETQPLALPAREDYFDGADEACAGWMAGRIEVG